MLGCRPPYLAPAGSASISTQARSRAARGCRSGRGGAKPVWPDAWLPHERAYDPIVLGAAAGEESIVIAATPDVLYRLVSDVTRMGEWSPECQGAEWIDGATGPAAGAAFRGHNRLGPRRWTTTSTVTMAEPGREFAFTVRVGGREATRWRYEFKPRDGGTVVTESFDYVWAPFPFAIGNFLLRRHRQLRKGMRMTLRRIKIVAEANDCSD
jgi:hypothetical protein